MCSCVPFLVGVLHYLMSQGPPNNALWGCLRTVREQPRISPKTTNHQSHHTTCTGQKVKQKQPDPLQP